MRIMRSGFTAVLLVGMTAAQGVFGETSLAINKPVDQISFMNNLTASINLEEHFSLPIFPKTSVKREAGAKDSGGISQSQLQAVLDRVSNVFVPEFESRGYTLSIRTLWADSEVNAYANMGRNDPNDRFVTIQGGLARYGSISEDAIAIVTCHEIGHHIGGNPNLASQRYPMSSEGQADYFATAKCFRQLFTLAENEAWYKTVSVKPALEAACGKTLNSREDSLSCIRSTMAAETLMENFRQLLIEEALKRGRRLKVDPYDISTPSTLTVRSTIVYDYPDDQCRLDTYYQGSMCDVSVNNKLTFTSTQDGACTVRKKYSDGVRPRCWFNEDNFSSDK